MLNNYCDHNLSLHPLLSLVSSSDVNKKTKQDTAADKPSSLPPSSLPTGIDNSSSTATTPVPGWGGPYQQQSWGMNYPSYGQVGEDSYGLVSTTVCRKCTEICSCTVAVEFAMPYCLIINTCININEVYSYDHRSGTCLQ